MPHDFDQVNQWYCQSGASGSPLWRFSVMLQAETNKSESNSKHPAWCGLWSVPHESWLHSCGINDPMIISLIVIAWPSIRLLELEPYRRARCQHSPENTRLHSARNPGRMNRWHYQANTSRLGMVELRSLLWSSPFRFRTLSLVLISWSVSFLMWEFNCTLWPTHKQKKEGLSPPLFWYVEWIFVRFSYFIT